MTVTRVDAPDGVSGVRLFTAVDADGRPIEGPRVAIVGVTHGNEPVGAAVIERLEADSGRLKAGSLLTVRANDLAARQNRRFTEDGVDLNRLYDRGTLEALANMPPESLCYEERRALELAPLLIACDAILDLHSTSRPSAPFLLYRDDQRHAAMAARLGVANLVTGMHESTVVEGGLCSNVGLYPGEPSERLGFTMEAGQHVDPGNVERAWLCTVRLLVEMGVWAQDLPAADVAFEVYEVLDRFVQAPSGAPRWSFVDPASAAYNRPNPRALESFEEVVADEQIVRRGTTVVRATAPFTMLMPAPDASPGSDLFFYAQRRHGGLSAGVFRTDDEARREASAIERMLDLLNDDGMEEGATWVTFDSRRCLDLCADMIGRTLRMDPADPHRRITVLGRGDWGGGESERRAGQRYRQVLRDAILAGVPIERLQMMRGASLGWLDALTSGAMKELVEQRVGTPMRLFLSGRQPHTVSLLVIGDIDLALRTQDRRACRVAVLIEAATVEPDEDTARVQVVRTGVIGARTALLEAARRVIHGMKTEHRHLVAQNRFLNSEAGQLLGPEGLFPSDEASLDTLRNVVLRLQLRLWCEALRPELPKPLHLPNSRALGRWLAAVMTRSGVLDVDALRSLLIRPAGLGWVADLARLERLAERGTAEELDAILMADDGTRSPRQPVVAMDVDGDNLERWIGWKRYLRGFAVVPMDRGKDLDLVFSTETIRQRVTGWLYEACARASHKPGEVLVVMAGDGLAPEADHTGDLLTAHRRMLLEPNLRYLRIQHAQGTHLAWMKDVVNTLRSRPAEGQPVSLLFEAEHGATVNVVMVCERDGNTDAWSLEGWRVECAAVVVSDLEGTQQTDYKLALFTERLGERGTINQELLHFCRAHCGGLLKQVGWRARGERGAPATGAIEGMYRHHLERWVDQVRSQVGGMEACPTDATARVDWVIRQLGIADRELAAAIAAEMETDTPAPLVAERVWEGAASWPGL
ncbi:MAG: succinylglutamate desuccinylase/aspartoacylase family protein [Myxococcales bacterium]|nr:succinylglutamate desuccinylase/aspartoacylase family protein [Myxococcales bacterium]MCB9670388.1 succinylglutamate desuccinylase/aspartoacylase family protein [Alphaproteobacteria bacterium]MCB9693918.1 succinylglutamate desuccinylase/aspartoacylase family protein [Alphaproteobacteria bacterium]